jgi:3-deoxy-manno-octulosonate cytidylyltransferase (CMP-KDO synthetase)
MSSLTPLIVIPARLASTRLPNKPLAMIGDASMIVQVVRRAREAQIAPVLVACDSEAIAEAVRRDGGDAILTDPALPSGSDRVWQAVCAYDPEEKYNVIINFQGDLPTFDPALFAPLIAPLADETIAISTLAARIVRPEEHTNPNVVKAIWAQQAGASHGRALYFTRATAPHGEGERWHHIGVYAYRRRALAQFVALPPSPLELREKLEQLRALEAGMHMEVVVAEAVPLGVDTPEDLERAREFFVSSEAARTH